MVRTTVMSLGGSIVVPNGVDSGFVARFVNRMTTRLEADPGWRLAIIVGGGSTARTYQRAAREIDAECRVDALDRIGIAATRVNAEVMRAAFGGFSPDPIVLDPTEPGETTGRVIIGGGWKPGFSTDNVAVHLAVSLGSAVMVNLSNISQIHTADPKEDPEAKPLKSMTWAELKKISGTKWTPGKNTPFDPAATARASEIGMTVITADGRDLENLEMILDGKDFVGTTIGPA